MSLKFQAIDSFQVTSAGGVVSQYVRGQIYRVRTPELEALAHEWKAAGRVRFTTDPLPKAQRHGLTDDQKRILIREHYKRMNRRWRQ